MQTVPTERSLATISVSGIGRNVSPEISRQQREEQISFGWRGDNQLSGYYNKYRLGGSGVGFVTSPYTAFWDLVWGATPIEDLAKYKEMISRVPYLAACERVKSSMAVSNGFEFQGGQDNVRAWLTEWCVNHKILQTLRIVAWDMLVYGNAYVEICKDDNTPPELWWLKPLDPVYMRVRRDEFSKIFGYIQLLAFPPVPFEAEEIIHFINEPKSNWYEANYGTSELRPLLLIQAYIESLERDLAIIFTVYT